MSPPLTKCCAEPVEAVTAPRLATRTALALGTFLVVAAVYVSSAPGRIDIIDGQFRYEVARNLIAERAPVLRDEAIRHAGVRGRDGQYYAFYGAPGSVLGTPLVWVGSQLGTPDEELSRSLFSFLSALLGAGSAVIVLLFLLELGTAPNRAVIFTAVFAFATLAWPAATSSFDQSQHGFFAILSAWLCNKAARSGRGGTAFAGGLAASVLFLYQEAYAAVIPFLALALLEGGHRPWRPERRRAVAFVIGLVPGTVASLAFNAWRFGDALRTGKGEQVLMPTFGDPIAGLVSLVASPGKSIVLFAPPVILAVVGLRDLGRQRPWLARAITGASAAHLALVSCLAFFGGDWAWGPRYLVPLLPLWALAMPWGALRLGRRGTAAVVAAGLAIQVLSLSVDHQRFFFERNLHPWFWGYDRWVYFRHDRSQLLARPGELVDVVRSTVPETARQFAPGPRAGATTYAPFGPSRLQRAMSERWMRDYRVFYLPRPWPLWMRHEPRRPFDPNPAALVLCAVACLGGALVGFGVRCSRTGDERIPASR